MTAEKLILDCLKVGLDGEKVDYEWEQNDEKSAVLKFEDGRRIRVSIEESSPSDGEFIRSL